MFQPCFSLVQGSAYPGQNGPNHIKWVLEVLVMLGEGGPSVADAGSDSRHGRLPHRREVGFQRGQQGVRLLRRDTRGRFL